MTITKILIGDDQFGADDKDGESLRRDIDLDYRDIFEKHGAELTYTADPEEFIRMAKTKEYPILLIDLKWYDDQERGYWILEAVRDCAPRRILWTSESAEARERGYSHGATHCSGKRPIPKKFEEILFG